MGLFSSIAKGTLLGPIGTMASGENSPFSGGSSAYDLVPGLGDARAQERANQANVQQAELNRRFQERMSNTAYQRGMDDMEKAGLNPMLAYMQGGASSPSGATAQIESASKTGLADMALKATTGVGGLQQQATALRQQQAMNESSIQLNAATAMEKAAHTQKMQQETKGIEKSMPKASVWESFYKKVNDALNATSKDVKKWQNSYSDKKEKSIKVLGPAKFDAIFGDRKSWKTH